MTLLFGGSKLVLREAWPPTSVTGEPRLAPLSVNWTEPVGVVTRSGAATVAVNVSDFPSTTGLADEVTATVVSPGKATFPIPAGSPTVNQMLSSGPVVTLSTP